MFLCVCLQSIVLIANVPMIDQVVIIRKVVKHIFPISCSWNLSVNINLIVNEINTSLSLNYKSN